MIGLVEARPHDPAPPPPGLLPMVEGVAMLVGPHGPGGNEHDRACRDVLLRRIAGLLRVPYMGVVDAAGAGGRRLLLVPGDTLLAADAAAAGIRGPDDLLGGVVPDLFVGTKAISHPLVDDAADRPARWSATMARALGDAALRGFTAFSVADAKRAGRLMLALGPVRLKDVCGKAGLGQQVVRDAAELDAALDREDADELAAHGIVLEEQLEDVVTYSVGSVALPGHRISYWGSQNLTRDHQDREVYAGSDLCVVRGGWSALAALDLPPALARAVECAATFDEAAHLAWPDLLLTRRNYDVIEGTDAHGARRIGVLEQSWRVGGASGAEVAALEAFAAEPGLASVRCSTVEVYGLVPPPTGATLYYQGIDPVVGAMTKYAMRLA